MLCERPRRARESGCKILCVSFCVLYFCGVKRAKRLHSMSMTKAVRFHSFLEERKQTTQRRDGRRTGSPRTCTSRILEGRSGTRMNGVGSASRHGARRGAGQGVHPHNRVPGKQGSPSRIGQSCTRRHGRRRGPPTGGALLPTRVVLLLLIRDSDRLAARCSVDSLLHRRSHLHLATCLQFLTGSLSLPHAH